MMFETLPAKLQGALHPGRAHTICNVDACNYETALHTFVVNEKKAKVVLRAEWTKTPAGDSRRGRHQDPCPVH
jgi:hypothetical protein